MASRRGVVSQAPTLIEQRHDAWINDAIMNLKSVPSRFDNAPAREALKLIRDRLRCHLQRFSQVTYAKLPGTHQGMQHPKSRRVRKHLEG